MIDQNTFYLGPSPVSTTAIDTPSSVFESSNHESPIDLSNLCKSGIDHAENAAAEPDTSKFFLFGQTINHKKYEKCKILVRNKDE